MPKQKTHKGLAKRIRVSKNGKLKVSHCGRRHLFSGKSSTKRRHLRKANYLNGFQEKYIEVLHNE